jgi:hypothetical protein
MILMVDKGLVKKISADHNNHDNQRSIGYWQNFKSVFMPHRLIAEKQQCALYDTVKLFILSQDSFFIHYEPEINMIIPLYLLLFLLLIYSPNTLAQSCWANFIPSNTSKTFILAMGANTGDLKKANDDAHSFAEAIQQRFQVPPSQTCVQANITFLDFRAHLKTLQKLVEKEDSLFIYFSGHGSTQADKNHDELDCQDEVFVTYDSNFRMTDDKFVKWVNKIQAKQIITFIDACFASGMLRGEKASPKRAKSKWFWPFSQADEALPRRNCQRYRQLPQLKGIFYAAAEEDKNAWEYPKEGGIFTYTFLEFMKKFPDADLDEIFFLTQEKIKKQTQNTACEQYPQRWVF